MMTNVGRRVRVPRCGRSSTATRDHLRKDPSEFLSATGGALGVSKWS